MNKKVLTLCAGFLLAGSMTSAFALSNPTVNVKSIEAGKAYQLTASNKLLIMTQTTDGSYKASFVEASSVTDLASSLWTISYTDNVVGGPDFKLVNKLTGCPLSVDLSALTTTSADVKMGGNVSEWKWLAASKSDSNLAASKLYSYFKTDSVVYLAYDTNTGALKAAKESATKYASSANLSIAPATAAAYTMTAKDLNTKLGLDPEGDSFNLSADPELKIGENSALGNIFTATALRAWNGNNSTDVVGKENETFELYSNTASGDPLESTTTANGYVMLQVLDNKNDDKPYEDTYVLADTAYIEGTANNLKLIKFGTDNFVTTEHNPAPYVSGAAKNRSIESYMFQFKYFPTEDSLAIFVKSYNDKATTAANGSYWTTKNTVNTLVTANKLTSTTELTVLKTAGPANISFMLGEGTTNRTSVDNNVYVIRNNKGQYLSVPIYNSNEANGFAAAKWVTLTEQDAKRMPAYQWVVLKNNKETEEIAKVSTVDVINREFTGVASDKVQLRQNAGGSYLFVSGNTLGSDSLVFEAVPAEIIKDKYLGYMNIDNQDLDVMNYNLNYFHPYASDKFIGLNDKDSLLTVKDANTSFYFTKGAEEKYGFDPKNADIKDLAQLVRYAYAPYIKTTEGTQYIGLDEEQQYYVAPSANEAKNFFFKENNYYKPEEAESARAYYALVDTIGVDSKAGTRDDDMDAVLKNQVMSETRTSAFAVVPNDAPLYRRFNSVALDGAVEGNEDAAKLLKFKELYRGEYLMDEANENFQNKGVNYLGIERADKAAAGLSFIVDTAIVNATKKGYIKPQYFVYVSKEEVEAVPGKPCDATDHKHMTADGKVTDDPMQCIHATPAKPGFTVAKYLVSFADSTSNDKLYKFGEYSRVGFVKGLHLGDSLYILTNGFEKMPASELDTATIIANYKATNNTKNIIDLKVNRNDKHHNYTWSFRYINPEAAATEEESARSFLFESNIVRGNDDIAPKKAAWLKSQNGCLVLSDPNTSTFENAKTGGDNALVFNIEVGSEDDMATSNEEISTSSIVVAGVDGAVVVKGAEGKNVIVSTILGKVVANEVVSSDNATIAAPAGIVVVSVDGESFKVVVK